MSEQTGSSFEEFEGIFMPHAGERPVMSKPPTMSASKKLIDQVRWELELPDDLAVRVADWAADRMERFAARTAQPVFAMDGSGPVCSHCGTIWPLCGHHHLSAAMQSEEPS